MKESEKIAVLLKNLSKCQKVTASNPKDPLEPTSELVHALLDIAESSYVFINKLLPKLYKDNINEEEVFDILLDIRHEIEHILYHIRFCRFFDNTVEHIEALFQEDQDPPN